MGPGGLPLTGQARRLIYVSPRQQTQVLYEYED